MRGPYLAPLQAKGPGLTVLAKLSENGARFRAAPRFEPQERTEMTQRATEPEYVNASFNRKMTLLRGVNDKVARRRSQSMFGSSFLRAVASTFECNQICFGAATGERAKAFRAVAN